MNETAVIKYPVPSFLNGICTESTYSRWLDVKSNSLFQRDEERNKPYVHGISPVQYRQLIHQAVIATGLYDPYTGEAMRWDLIGTWDSASAHAGHGTYKRQFALMPTVDHTDPESDTLSFEICSWQVNDCKGDFAPDDFIAFFL
jgi:hypothetical protein